MSSSTECNPNIAPTYYHIYPRKVYHKCIKTEVGLENERRLKIAKRKLRGKEKKQAESVMIEQSEEDDNPFFLHKPYLAFHHPPKVLYTGQDKNGKPAVLIHGAAFWREYKLQYGGSLVEKAVIDPRGVVKWKHNGGNRDNLALDDRKLKGYRVRNWRLWGESGKQYVRQVKTDRKSGTGQDPDVLVSTPDEEGQLAKADGVVYLKWERPFSLKARQYHFTYAGIDFRWKGTHSVRTSGVFGIFLRYNHLKLEAQLPVTTSNDEAGAPICLGKYISSIARKKCGRLELYGDKISIVQAQVTRLAMENGAEENAAEQGKNLKDTNLYKIIVSTAMCMIESEKEKRTAVGKWILEAAQDGGGG